MPLDGDDDGCGSPQPLNNIVVSTTTSDIDSPAATILAPYEQVPIPQPSTSQHPHATLPVSHQSQTPIILGTTCGLLIALVACYFAARYVSRRRSLAADPFQDPPKPGFTAFRCRPRHSATKRRLSDESWVSPTLPSLRSPGLPLSRDLELSQYACPQRKLVPVTTPVCTPTDTEFGSRTGLAGSVRVPPVRVPSPAYISPFSPSPTPSLSSSSLSPTPSTEPLTSPTSKPAHFSRLLSSTFRVSRPTTAHLIQAARAYAHAYRPSSTTSTSVYTPATWSGTSFHTGATARDTISTVTTSDTDTLCTVPHLLRAVAITNTWSEHAPTGTSLGLKVRLSDASEHAHYRLRERERQRERERLSTETFESTGRKEFRLRDSESVLREIGW